MLKKFFAIAALTCLLTGVSACAHHHHGSDKSSACECQDCKSGHCSADGKDSQCDGHCKAH